MVGYTQFSRHSTYAEQEKIWNPSKTLGIINTDPGYECITCIGYAPSQGRRCRNPIRKDNREFITETLNDIAYLQPDSPEVVSRLREIAGPALCVRYHQNQAEKVVTEWQRKIQHLKHQIRERNPAKPVQSSETQKPVQDQTIKDLQEQLREMREFLARLREEHNSQWQPDQGYDRREEEVAKDREDKERERRKKEERDREAKRHEKERLQKERLEKERIEKERLDKERKEKEEKERREREREREHVAQRLREERERRRREKEQKEKEPLEKERLEKERIEKERLDKEKKENEEKERREHNERLRQRAQRLREEREQKRVEKEQKEKEEWAQSWTKYQERWVDFRASPSREGSMRDAIPWPVKSGSYRDVKASNVKEFFQKAVPTDMNMKKFMRKECLKWHPDATCNWLQGSRLDGVEEMMVETICRVVTGLINDSAGRSAEFLG